MRRNLCFSKNEGKKRGLDIRKALRNAKLALGFSAIMGLASCGDTINQYYQNADAGTPDVNVTVNMPENERQVSALCQDDSVTTEVSSTEVTVNQGETFVFSNGYRMTLLDIEAETQTAFFDMKDAEGNHVRIVDMEEGTEYLFTFEDGDVAAAACSVRAGYSFGERSVTLRADSDLSLYTEEEPVNPVCDSGLDVVSHEQVYNWDLFSAVQYVEEQLCEGNLFREVSVFDPPVEVELNEAGAVLGLPQGRYSVRFMGEEYVLADLLPDRMTIAKESIAGIINQGESLPVDDLRVQLDDLEVHGDVTAAIISIVDSMGNVLQRDRISAGQTKTYNIGGREYNVHAYSLAPGYTFGAKWADLAIFSEIVEIREDTLLTNDLGTFRFSMDWSADMRLRGWILNNTDY